MGRRCLMGRRCTLWWCLLLPTVHGFAVRVAMTRELGKNDKLRQRLEEELDNDLELLEVPCIQHAAGPDLDQLTPSLSPASALLFDYVIVTSPESAKIVARHWMGENRLAVVGKATQAILAQNGLEVDFVPSKATAKCLGAELPMCNNVLYPTSCKAATTLQDTLQDRGIAVTRLNTYDTVPTSFSDPGVDICCFGSPSAVKSWVANTQNTRIVAACIGETSAQECRRQNIARCFFPENPGLDGWLDSIKDAIAFQREHVC